MNKGVQILLERMESNPDEFYVNSKTAVKWRDIVEQIYQRVDAHFKNPNAKPHWEHQLHFLSMAEIIELRDKMQQIRAEEFTQDVMARLLADADDGNYHASAQYQSNTPKTISVPNSQIDIMRGYLEQQSKTEKQELYDALTKLETRRAFGKGK
jgi:hypothetical protein